MEIWKFKLDSVVQAPDGAKVLTVQVQHETPHIWMLVDPLAPKKDYLFNVIGTGWTIPNNPGNYLGTFQLQYGDLVFHVFQQDV